MTTSRRVLRNGERVRAAAPAELAPRRPAVNTVPPGSSRRAAAGRRPPRAPARDAVGEGLSPPCPRLAPRATGTVAYSATGAPAHLIRSALRNRQLTWTTCPARPRIPTNSNPCSGRHLREARVCLDRDLLRARALRSIRPRRRRRQAGRAEPALARRRRAPTTRRAGRARRAPGRSSRRRGGWAVVERPPAIEGPLVEARLAGGGG